MGVVDPHEIMRRRMALGVSDGERRVSMRGPVRKPGGEQRTQNEVAMVQAREPEKEGHPSQPGRECWG